MPKRSGLLAGALLAAGCSSSGVITPTSSGTTGTHHTTSATSSTSSSTSASTSSTSGATTSTGATTSGTTTTTSSTTSSTSTTSGATIDGGPDCYGPPSGCWSDEGDGGPCITVADCDPGLVCAYNDLCYAGFCMPPPPSFGLDCLANGEACTDGGPPCCEEPCENDSCSAFIACGENESPCASDLDCCTNFACNGSTCQSTCGQLYASCQSDSDCCYGDGLGCQYIESGGTPVQLCYPGAWNQVYEANGTTPVNCGAPCSTYECQLGAACQPGPTDPCAAAGEVCDTLDGQSYNCRNPRSDSSQYANDDFCIPGGQPCETIPASTVQPICQFFHGEDAGYCVQPCTQTSDCVNPIDLCTPFGGDAGSFCEGWAPCTLMFEVCDAGVTPNDGLCEPKDFGYGLTGFCTQATLDGGGPQARVVSSFTANRQNGSFCDTKDVSDEFGLCEPVCNGGTVPDSGPLCPPGQTCFNLLNPLMHPIEIGFCSPACDFTSTDGGGCPKDATGIQERCIPQLLQNRPDAPTGICGATSPHPLGLGAICPNETGGQNTPEIDECGAGTLCTAGSVLDSILTCKQLCTHVGTNVGCPSGTQCTALDLGIGGIAPTQTGLCE